MSHAPPGQHLPAPAALGEAVYRSLFGAYPDALLLVDNQGRVVLANQAASELLGYGAEELTGLTVEDLVPDSIRPRHAQYRDAYGHAPRPRPMGTQMDLVAKRKDGSEVMVEIALSPLQQQGLPYVVAAIRGIGAYPRVKQALKRAHHAECIARMSRLAADTRDVELLLHELPAAAAEALEADQGRLYVLEADGQQFRRVGGDPAGAPGAEPARLPNRADTAPGRVWAAGQAVRVPDTLLDPLGGLADPQDPPGTWRAALGVPVAERGRTLGVLLARWRHPVALGDDDLRFLESMANLLATALQRAQSEAALSHAQRLESVGQLTGGIAHDFNNLLTVIHGNLQVLEDLPTVAADPMAPELVAAAARACRRGADLTGQLLAFSRRQVLQPRPVDLQRMLPALADMLRRTLDRRIVIGVAIEPGCPPCKADPGQLESALLNIAINARDAMPEGGTLRFAARRVAHLPAGVLDSAPPEAAAFVAISLADSGSGMSEAVKARAFEPFFTTKDAGRGTGLGLSTVYGFARQSQGGVTLHSAPGAGTTVTLYIPAVDAPAAARAPAGRSAHGVPAGLQVMVVEDEPAVQRVVEAFLQAWGCQVLLFPSAEAALPALAQPAQRVDLLLSDVVLGPGLRGTTLAGHARRLRPALPVLLMSGYSSELLAGEAVGGPGAPELLRKPFSKAELAQAIARALAFTAPSPPPDGRPG